MKILGLVGMPGAGKGVISQYCKISSIPVVRMGDMVQDEVESRGLEVNKDTMGRIASEMREKEGMDIWARRTAAYIEDYIAPKDPAIAVIDGIRNFEEIEYFRSHFGADDFLIVAVHASPRVRYKRILARRREDDGTTLDDLIARDRRELSWGIANVIVMADYMILNEGTILEMEEKSRALLDKIMEEG